jgi:hypothetical protein
MRFAGLSLCLLVSTLSARAQSAEDRVATLEGRVKALEEVLRSQEGPARAPSFLDEQQSKSGQVDDSKSR